MNSSPEIDKLAAALAKAQGQMDPAEKSGLNPHFRSRYADLSDVRTALRGPLSQNGLAYVQVVRSGEDFVEIETRLLHESGQWLGDSLRIPLAQPTAQAVGSAISYGRRYALMALVGLAAEDDDGTAATPANGVSSATTPKTSAPPAPSVHPARRPDPTTGEEMWTRILGLEARLVERGRCQGGEVQAAIRASLRRAGIEVDVLELSPEAVRLAWERAKQFERERREGAKVG